MNEEKNTNTEFNLKEWCSVESQEHSSQNTQMSLLDKIERASMKVKKILKKMENSEKN